MMLRYRMLFLSRKTFLTSVIGAFILLPVSTVLMKLTGQLTAFTAVCCLLNLLLCVGLTAAWLREDVIRVSGLVAGILLVELCRYAYVSEQYISAGVDAVVAQGLVACMMFSDYLMVCCVLLMVTYNHFTIFVGQNSGRTKMAVNQVSICVLLLCFLVLTAESWMMGGSLLRQVSGALGFLSDLCLIMAVACCELYLAVDGQMLASRMERGD